MRRKMGGLIHGRILVQVLLVCAIVGCIYQPETTSSTDTISSTEDTASCTEVISSTEDTISCTAIIDGDTFRLETGQPVRLIGIDAPELSQPGGEQSREYLAHLILGRTITLEKGYQDQDKYNRLLRFVYIGNLCINEEMIRQGYAEARYLPDDPVREYYIQLEIEAETSRAGLWSNNIFQPRSHVDWGTDIPVITWSDAHTYLNQYVIVEGTIVNTHNTGTVCFLNFHTDYRYFTAVIFACDFPQFPHLPEVFYCGKPVHIIGIIKEYKNSPEIIVKTPDQIRILNEGHHGQKILTEIFFSFFNLLSHIMKHVPSVYTVQGSLVIATIYSNDYLFTQQVIGFSRCTYTLFSVW
jgi:micrococcal nuclease